MKNNKEVKLYSLAISFAIALLFLVAIVSPKTIFNIYVGGVIVGGLLFATLYHFVLIMVRGIFK